MAKVKRLWKPLSEVPKRTRKGSSRVQELVDDFVKSKASVGEVEKWGKTISVATSIRNYVRSKDLPIEVKTVSDRVILVRK